MQGSKPPQLILELVSPARIDGVAPSAGVNFFVNPPTSDALASKEEFVELHRIIATGLLIKVLPAKLPRVEWEHQRSLTPFQEADYEAPKDSVGEVWRGRPANAT